MRFLLKMIERIIQFQKNKKSWWKVVRFLECITVFVTTYALILPAISLSQDTARQQDGISLQESVDTVQEAAASGNDMSASSEQAEYDVEGSIQSSDNAVQEETVDAAALTGTVYPKSLDLRSEKKMNAGAIMVIPQGTLVTVLENQGDGWLLISTPDGWNGYVKAAEIFLPDEKVEEKRPKMTFELIADRNSPDAFTGRRNQRGFYQRDILGSDQGPCGGTCRSISSRHDDESAADCGRADQGSSRVRCSEPGKRQPRECSRHHFPRRLGGCNRAGRRNQGISDFNEYSD